MFSNIKLPFLYFRFADKQEVAGKDGVVRKFNHPFMQSAFMFAGEMLCLLIFKIAFIYFNRLGVSKLKA